MIIMSVDLGDARTGIAVSDINEGFAFPRTVINEWNKERLIEKILIEAKESGAGKIVVGLPKNMDGSEGFRADACKELGEKLKNLTEIPIKFWDERLTTVSAHKILSDNNVRGKKRKAVVDAVAADIILQDYIDSRKFKKGI